MNTSKFSNFDITVRSSTGGAWSDETLYVNGLTDGDAAYIHQAASTTKYYEIKVASSYDKVDETSQISAAFQFTPLPQDSFT